MLHSKRQIIHATLSVLLVIALLPLAAQADDLKKLAGTWEVVSAKNAGKDTDRPLGDRAIFTGESMKIVPKDKNNTPPPEVKIQIDEKQNPAHIDLVFTVGDKQRKSAGVYKIEGDTLKLCIARPDTPRPTALESKEGDKQFSLVFKRVKE